MKITKQDYRNMILLYAGVLLLTGIPAFLMTTSTIIDETGTLANAALLSGRNWYTGMQSSGGYYYRYGMAFVWFFPFLLLKDPVLIYRVCGLIDAAFFGLIPVLVYEICRRDLKVEKRSCAVLISLAACCPGDVLFFSLNRRGDVMLSVMNWVCLFLLLRLADTESGKRKTGYSVLLSFFSVFAYASHSRGIVTLIAVVITVAVLGLVYRKANLHIAAWAVSLVVFLAVDKLLQILFRTAIWGDGARHATGISAKSIGLLFTVSGIKSLIKLAVGWLFDAFASTAGLCCAGSIAGIVFLALLLRRSEKLSVSEGIAGLFSLLSFLGSYALGILFFLNSVHQNFIGKSSGRADRIVYGRYMSCALGLLVFLGVYVLICRKDLFGLREKIVSVCGYGIIFLLFAFKVTPWLGEDYIQRNIGVAAAFLRLLKQQEAESSGLLAKALILFGALTLLAFLVILLLSYGKRAYWICVMSITAGAVLFIYHTDTLLLKKHEKVLAQMQGVYECVSSCGDVYAEYPLVWVSSGVHAPLKAYQVLLMDYDLLNRKFKSAGGSEEMFMLNGELQDRSKYNFEELDNMFVIAGSLPAVSELPEGDYYLLEGAEYDVKKQDVVYVKGKSLKEELENRGFEMIPLSAAADG